MKIFDMIKNDMIDIEPSQNMIYFGNDSKPTHQIGNPYGNGYGVEMDGNGARLVKILWIGLEMGHNW